MKLISRTDLHAGASAMAKPFADGIGSDGISEDRGETISQARCQQGNDNQRKQTQKTKGLLLC
jgi:hypothetical protein